MTDRDTEQHIKETARRLFQDKGFAATKTRDIAESANINLALLNYYFRSKKKLYDLIMIETIQDFFSGLMVILNNEETELKQKIVLFVESYIDMLSGNPALISFILNEVRNNPLEFRDKLGILDKAKHSVFINQFWEAVQRGAIPPINPLHFLMNLSGLVVFPFISLPMISAISGLEKETLVNIIQERKRLIPLWLDSMLSIK